ncbi:MAG: ATP-binding protein [Nitrospiraceae bacterium]|nr:ATP-binding protein [Nitrospiraceae bacterium]
MGATGNPISYLVTPLSLLIGFSLLFFVLMSMLLGKFSRGKGRAAPKKTSEVGFVVDTFQDLVTKLKDNERELVALRTRAEDRASLIENLSENILESVPSGVISFNEDLEITMVNSAAERIMGFKRREAVGKQHDNVLKGQIARFIEQKKTVERQELSYPLTPGRQLWLGFSITPLHDANGQRLGLILVFTDLTELKVLERQAELRRRLSSLGEMAAGLAHELRNSMAVIAGYAKMLAKIPGDQPQGDQSRGDQSPEVNSREAGAARAIGKEVAAMNSIIDGFLSFANPVKPALDAVTGKDLLGLLKTCMSAALAGDTRIAASLSSGDGEFTMQADEILLKQAFMNLIQNAVQAMPEGGELDVRAEKKGAECLICISDTGPGIPEEMRQKIFLPFYTTKQSGTGLGLAIVHSIVQSHLGSIGLETSAGGSRFLIRLPLSE